MFLKLLTLFIITPILEMAILIELGKRIGTLPTIAIIVFTGFIGAALAKSQGVKVYWAIKESLQNGRLPHNPLIEGLLILIGGAFLITPGILTDIVGFILVIPWSRKYMREKLKKHFKNKIIQMNSGIH